MATRRTPERKASKMGYHFYNLYQNCRWKFFIKYVLQLDPVKTSAPLVLGAAFHEGKATWYLTGDRNKAVEVCVAEIKDRRSELEEDAYARVLARAPIMLTSWIDEHGERDLEVFNVIDVEKYVEVPLELTSHKISMRFDAILQYKNTGNYVIMETKSTQSSIEGQKRTVATGDQATTYTWGFRKEWPDRPLLGVIPDITYWHSSSTNPDKIINYRGFHDPVIRTNQDLQEYELYTADLLSEISQRIGAYKKGPFPPIQLFGRNTQWCDSYFRPCEYWPICRNCKGLEDPDFISDGYTKGNLDLKLGDVL